MGKLRIKPNYWPRDEQRRREIQAMVEVTAEQVAGRKVNIYEGHRCFETDTLNLPETHIAIFRDRLEAAIRRQIKVRAV